MLSGTPLQGKGLGSRAEAELGLEATVPCCGRGPLYLVLRDSLERCRGHRRPQLGASY